MAERLGAKFTIDITDLKTGIRTANDLIKQNEAAFQADVAEMGNWQKSEEGLRKRLETLASKFDIQKKKVDDLIKERQRLIEEAKKQNKTDEEIAKITSQVNSMLDRETKALDSVRRETEKTEKSLDDLGKENEEAGKSAENASNGGFTVMKGALANLAAEGIKAAVNGLKKLAGAIVNAGARADDLNTLAKQSGFTTAELQKFDYAADLIDVSTADIVSSARKLKKNLTSTSSDVTAAFDQIGVSVRDESGELRNANDVFYDVIEGLSKIENETEKDTLAMTLFGKGADDLAGIIDDGGKALRDYGKEAEDLGIILEQDTLDKANEFNDSIDRIKATGKGLFAEIGAELAGELSPEIDSARETVQKLIKSGELKRFTKKAVAFIKDVAKSAIELGKEILPTVVKAIKLISDGIKALIPIIKPLISVAGNAVDSLSQIVGTFLGIPREIETPASELAAKMSDLKSAAEESAGAFDSAKSAADDSAAANLNAIKPTQDLWNELQNIVDANGKIKEGYEDRAKYLTEQLGTDTGIAIEMIDGEIQKYGELKQAIEDVIQQRRVMALSNAYEDIYTESISKIEEYEKAWSDAETELNEATAARDRFFKMVDNNDPLLESMSAGDIEREMAKLNKTVEEATEAAKTRQATLAKAREVIIQYESAQTAILEKDYNNAEKILKEFNKNVEKAEKGNEEYLNSLTVRARNISNVVKNLSDEFSAVEDEVDERHKKFLTDRLAEWKALAEEAEEEMSRVVEPYKIYVPTVGTGKGLEKGASVGSSGGGSNVVINQTNNYSAAHSRYEMYQSKADMLVALRLAQTEGY